MRLTKPLFVRIVFLVVALSLPTIDGMVAFADTTPTNGTIKSIVNNTPFYDPSEIASSCFAGANIDANGVSKLVFDTFTAKGYKPFQAAAIIGNMQAESGLRPQRLQGTSAQTITTAEDYLAKYAAAGQGWGLTQWTPGTKFINTNTPVANANDPAVQVNFVWQQLEGQTPIPEKRAGDDIKATTTIEDAVLAFQGNLQAGGRYFGYERPADESGSVAVRTSFARSALATYGSTTGTPAAIPSTSCGAGSTATVDGKYALPLPQALFDKNPSSFNQPHHDYPSDDIMAPRGTPVYAALSGKIIYAPLLKYDPCYGHGIAIQSGDIFILYGHGYDGGSIPGAQLGDTVKAGQLIMHVDSEGCSTGDHLHFDIRVGTMNSAKLCPQSWLMAVGNKQTPPDIRSLPSSGCVGGHLAF